MTVFKLAYGRRFRTAPYETAEIMIEQEWDNVDTPVLSAHNIMKNWVDALVEADKEYYAREAASHPEKRS